MTTFFTNFQEQVFHCCLLNFAAHKQKKMIAVHTDLSIVYPKIIIVYTQIVN